MKVGYARVSTREQSETDALEQQTARIKKAGAVQIFCDIESGKSDRRSQFNKMLELCKCGEITEIVVTRIDRLSRSVISIHKAMTLLEDLGVKLTILDAPIDDISSPFGWFSMAQMGQLAEFESRLLSSRIRHGLDYFREQKKAAPRPPFGYARINEKYAPDLAINEKSGMSNWDVALDLVNHFLAPDTTTRGAINYSLDRFEKKWTQAGFRYYLLNPTLRGHTVYNVRNNQNNPERWVIHEDTHTPLISPETFKKIEQRFEENRHKYAFGNNKKDVKPLPLQGQLICGCCGYKLFIKKSGKYLTYRVRCKKRDTLGEKFCSNKIAIHLSKVVETVDQELIQRSDEIAKLAKKAAAKNKEPSPEIAKLNSQLQALKNLPKSEILDAAIKQTQQEIKRIEQGEEVSEIISQHRRELVTKTLANADYWDSLPESEKITIYQKLVDQIVILNGEILEINLLF